ncbi:M48 family metalloprotease [Falsochrobactrum sp. TDYN1]|uniref:M48 family metalloprotease n=1 Tax=Falsochrobactrum tianjinense TaxID=2706015 RepID=A0A949PTT5_9HYPH|nr:cell division protease CdlP [Falsochrobactrum sp. TDYN1]MBV2144770.1 M48 family metalloprotease [Falsochrobactrum sp. TDYN1]
MRASLCLPDLLPVWRPRNWRQPATGLGLLAVSLISGCQSINSSRDLGLQPSSSPVTVENVTRNDRLAQLGAQQHPRILATYGGEYKDPKLERMVAKIVGKLTTVSDKPDQTYRITILDSPNINAFALPGGFLYITRGLLALANDSSEVAAVIAHEMGHVVANHGILRQEKEAETAIAGRVASEVLHNEAASREATIRGKLRLAQFSRNQELQADVLGIRMIGEAGYDPFASARFLQSMEAYTSFRSVSGATDASLDFLASHPATPQRIELALGHARRIGAPGVGTADRDPFLNGIDGLLYGDSPNEGYVRGQTFLHPKLGVAFRVPDGFSIDNSANAVMASGPGEIAIRFDGASLPSGSSLTDYIRSGWVKGLDESSIRPLTINGMPAASARASADRWQFDIVVISINNKVYRFLIAAPKGSGALSPASQAVTQSFRQLSDTERAAIKPLRIRVVTVKPGDTMASLAARMQDATRKLDLFRLLNAMPAGATVSVGDRVKLISE